MQVTRSLSNAPGCTSIESLLFLRDEVDDPVMKACLSLVPFIKLLSLSSKPTLFCVCDVVAGILGRRREKKLDLYVCFLLTFS